MGASSYGDDATIGGGDITVAAADGDGSTLVLSADNSDDAGDDWQLAATTSQTLTIGSDKAWAGTFVPQLTLTPHATPTSSTTVIAGKLMSMGDVGIGTASPSWNLHVVGDTAVIRIDSSEDTHGKLEWAEDGTRKWLIYNDYSNDNLTFKTNTTELMEIEQAGDVSILTDGGDLKFGASSEIKLTHVADSGLSLKHTATSDNKPIIFTLQTGETTIVTGEVLGQIDFQAPDEASSGDSRLVAAGIAAVAEGNFSSSSNACKLSFKTASTATAAETMSLSSAGVLTCDGGVAVDNITIDGTEIDLSSGDLTLDVAGDIVLSADGGNVTMDDGTTTIFDFDVNNCDFTIHEDSDTGDYFKIAIGSAGATTITTIDDTGSSANLDFDIDGAIELGSDDGTTIKNSKYGGYALHVFNDYDNQFAYGMKLQAGSDAGTATIGLRFLDGDGTTVGTISWGGGTVGYGTFTGNHLASIPASAHTPDEPQPYAYGTIMKLLGTVPGGKERQAEYSTVPTTAAKDKAAWGIYSMNMPDSLTDDEDNAVSGDDNKSHVIFCLGDGHVLVCDEGGNVEVGDYICSSNIEGHGMKQDDDLLHNYTVAKACEAVNWDTESSTTKLVACTYHAG